MPTQVLLASWTRQTDFVVQTPFANRDRLDVQTMVGDLSGEALIRATFHGRPSFGSHVTTVQRHLLEARSNSEVPMQIQASFLKGSPQLSALRVRLGMPVGLQATAKSSTPHFAGLQTSPVSAKVSQGITVNKYCHQHTGSFPYDAVIILDCCRPQKESVQNEQRPTVVIYV